MAKAKPTTDRRDEALSHERIVDAAIALLDAEGEAGLTFRALATKLATGSGALYWHIASKGELLAAASDAVIVRALADVAIAAAPKKAIRSIAVGVFEAVDAHPWVGAQLSQAPWRMATLQIFERIGREVQALGVSGGKQFTAVSALVSYIVGGSIQNAAQARALTPPVDRAEFLARLSDQWKELDADEYRFTRRVAPQLRAHDDRVEFLAGVDLLLSGVRASR